MTPRAFRLLAAALLALAPAVAIAADTAGAPVYEEKSLLSPDGTLFVVRAGSAADLGIAGPFAPTDKLVEWSSRAQDGTISSGIIPDTDNADVKHNLELAYDDPTDSLVLLWNEELTVLNVLRLGVFRNGVWSVGNLLPSLGMTHAYNPQMLLSHQVVKLQDDKGNPISQTRTLLSVIWWEDAKFAQARYAPIFLDDDPGSTDVQVYDLPLFVGGGGAPAAGAHPTGSYMYPTLQPEGIGGAMLASFADLSQNKHFVIRITFPDNLGRPGPDNATWLRRRIPVVGVASESPISDDVPIFVSGVKTAIGASYRPTLYWNTGTAVAYTRFDGRAWSSVRTIPFSDTMNAERALRLVQEMAMRY